MMASSFKYGTSCSPCRTSSEEVVQEVQGNENKRNCDPDRLIQCPFDKNHQIRSARFPYHLIKCRKNHPKLASELKTCPFNARHLFPKHELSQHMESCENRIAVDAEDGGSANERMNVPVNVQVIRNMTEDWDKELDDSPTPFVWGVNQSLTQIMSSNSLSPQFRAPATLPWAGYEQ